MVTKAPHPDLLGTGERASPGAAYALCRPLNPTADPLTLTAILGLAEDRPASLPSSPTLPFPPRTLPTNHRARRS